MADSTTARRHLDGDAPKAAQPTTFDARHTLEGRHDDTTVAQATREPAFQGGTPTPGMAEPTEEGRR